MDYMRYKVKHPKQTSIDITSRAIQIDEKVFLLWKIEENMHTIVHELQGKNHWKFISRMLGVKYECI